MVTEMSLGARLRQAQEPAEEPIVHAIEDEVARLPKDAFVWGALGVLGLSLALFNTGRKADAMFVGGLATPILALGLYKKLVTDANDDMY